MAMIGWAEVIRAAPTIAEPTPPAPKTAIDCPTFSPASLLTTPKAVVTAQPISAPDAASSEAGTRVTRFSEMTASSLNVVTHPAFTGPRADGYRGVGAWIPAPFRQ